MTTNKLIYHTNNADALEISQDTQDGPAMITTSAGSYTIPAGEMVMLFNWYRYVKDNDIQDDFINPDGRREQH